MFSTKVELVNERTWNLIRNFNLHYRQHDLYYDSSWHFPRFCLTPAPKVLSQLFDSNKLPFHPFYSSFWSYLPGWSIWRSNRPELIYGWLLFAHQRVACGMRSLYGVFNSVIFSWGGKRSRIRLQLSKENWWKHELSVHWSMKDLHYQFSAWIWCLLIVPRMVMNKITFSENDSEISVDFTRKLQLVEHFPSRENSFGFLIPNICAMVANTDSPLLHLEFKIAELERGSNQDFFIKLLIYILQRTQNSNLKINN